MGVVPTRWEQSRRSSESSPDEVRILIPTFYTQMLFNHVQTLNITLSIICELPLIFFTLIFIIDIETDGVIMQKTM